MVIRGLKVAYAAMRKHATLRRPMQQWIEVVEHGSWQNLIEMRSELPTADAIKRTPLTCFNIGGNNYRLMTVVSYERSTVDIVEVLTHAEYTKKYVR